MDSFDRLVKIVDELREKCPWDNEQTFDSLRALTIEETYELTDAIIRKDHQGLKSEVGDLLMHMVFYCKIADELGHFDLNDVLNSICLKLIQRHPHIYQKHEPTNSESVKKNWEKIKLNQGQNSVLQGVPKSLPPLSKAMRIQEKVSAIGFDWKQTHQVLQKVNEEVKELHKEIQNNNMEAVEEEFGDLLFSLVNYARFVGVEPDRALDLANKKFIKRFNKLEKLVAKDNKYLTELSEVQLDQYWVKSKCRVDKK